MNMNTSLSGRLRNTDLPKSHGLMPLFEAVVNSIHSIEDAKLNSTEGKITVEIIRALQQSSIDFDSEKKRGVEALPDILGFKIIDNGVGFTDKNMSSFQTLDSELKADRGCRGVGRLLWLKAFLKVSISSTYFEENGKYYSRTFEFNKANGVISSEATECSSDGARETVVHLDGFLPSYRKTSKKTLQSIANALFEHCIWYYIREGSAPQIFVTDGDSAVDLYDIYQGHMLEGSRPDSLEIKGEVFEITHTKLLASSIQTNNIAFCAANRLVKEENLNGKIKGLHGKMPDKDGKHFTYTCYVTSKYLDKQVRSERTGFNIEEDAEGLLEDTEISLQDIRKAVSEKIEDYLKDFLDANSKASKERVEKFVSSQAPRYKPIMKYIQDESLSVDPDINDKDLDIILHKQLYDLEKKLIHDGHDIMTPKVTDSPISYKEKLENYLATAKDIKQSDLANYVFHRKVILDIFEKAIERKADGTYAREDLIHTLIMPMIKDSTEVHSDECNLWLIDERMAFHDYLASDKTLSSMPITDSSETKEPDLLSLEVFDNPLLVSEGQKLPLAAITVVEIKRPMRNDTNVNGDKDPILQALRYVEKIRNGKVTTATGRPIPNADSIPAFCYVLSDLAPKVLECCKMHNLKITGDTLGYFGYNDNYKAYIEVISFDRLLNSAKERNRAFFDKLGLPAN